MLRKPIAWPSSHLVQPPALDRSAAERVAQWVTRWHEADYDRDEITEMLEGWPARISLDELLAPFEKVPEKESDVALARLVLRLISLVERGRLDVVHARGAFRTACRQLCERGIPFEETAKGDETALWFHFIGVNEFGDSDNTGFVTDFSELRLLARLIINPDFLVEEFLAGEFPKTFHEGFVNVAGALGDPRLLPLLLRVLRRCDDPQSVAVTIGAIGRLDLGSEDGPANAKYGLNDRLADTLTGYAYSSNPEIATTATLTLETIGGRRVEAVLRELADMLPEDENLLAAHVRFALTRITCGEDTYHESLITTAGDPEAPTAMRLCAIERLGGMCDQEAVRTLAGLLDDPTTERVKVDGYLTDDVVYVVRESAFMSLMDCPIRYIAEVLGEDILGRLESFQMYSVPPWWMNLEQKDDEELWEPSGEL